MAASLVVFPHVVAAEGEPTPKDLMAVIGATMEALEDFQFVYEGEFRHSDPDQDRRVATDFQGTYAYRMRDGSTLVDLYIRRLHGEVPLRRMTNALLGTRLETMDYSPDLTRAQAAIGASFGGPGVLTKPLVPERMLMFPYFRRLWRDPAGHELEVEGWETIQERRCLRILANQFDDLKGRDRPVVRMWLDLERGGYPLKVEYSRGDVMRMRTHEVTLDPIALPDGRKVWLPVHAITDSFSLTTGERPGSAYIRETTNVVRSSIRVNQGLRDEVFVARWEGRLPASSTPKGLADEFEAASRKSIVSRPRTDPKGVEERLEARLAEAEAQSRELEASSPAREAWSWETAWQVGIAGVALACVVAGIVLRRRGG